MAARQYHRELHHTTGGIQKRTASSPAVSGSQLEHSTSLGSSQTGQAGWATVLAGARLSSSNSINSEAQAYAISEQHELCTTSTQPPALERSPPGDAPLPVEAAGVQDDDAQPPVEPSGEEDDEAALPTSRRCTTVEIDPVVEVEPPGEQRYYRGSRIPVGGWIQPCRYCTCWTSRVAASSAGPLPCCRRCQVSLVQRVIDKAELTAEEMADLVSQGSVTIRCPSAALQNPCYPETRGI